MMTVPMFGTAVLSPADLRFDLLKVEVPLLPLRPPNPLQADVPKV